MELSKSLKALDVEISPVSGITQDWNHSDFNKQRTALKSMEEIISSLDTKYAIIMAGIFM